MIQMMATVRAYQGTQRLLRDRSRSAPPGDPAHARGHRPSVRVAGRIRHAIAEHRCHGHDGPAAQRRGDLQQPRQHDDLRLQAPAGGVPGSSVSEPAPDRRRQLGCRHDRAGGRADRPRGQTGRGLSDQLAGQHDGDREPARSRDPGRGLLHRRAPERRACLYPRRQLPAQPRRPAGDRRRLYREPRHHRAPGRGPGDRQRQRPGPGQAAVAGRAGRSRPARARDLRQQGRAGGDRQQPPDRDAGVRPGDRQRPRHGRLRRAAAGLPGELERQSGAGDDRIDRGPAGLRPELQGDHGERRDDGRP